MINNPIYITVDDRRRLLDLIDDRREWINGDAVYVDALAREVARSCIVDKRSLPGDVVTMNSTVRLRDMESTDVENYTLVYPSMADPIDNRLSVLAPVGTAIIGSRSGDMIEWPVPAGVRRLVVEEVVYQPERAGAID